MDEKKLKKLFDFQKFASNAELQKLITDTEKKYPKSITDDDMGFVNAAGGFNNASAEYKSKIQ